MKRRPRFITAFIATLVLLTSITKLNAQEAKKPEITDAYDAIIYVRSLHYDRNFELGMIEEERLIKNIPNLWSCMLGIWLTWPKMTKKAVFKAEKLVEESLDNPWSHFALVSSIYMHDER